MINKAKKKPIEIEFIEYTDDTNIVDLYDWSNDQIEIVFENDTLQKRLYVNTLEGDMLVNTGDYIIKGINGEVYPCKPDIFYKTYELV
ncbi:hypothetical protein QI302_02315 [Staphylococcus saprophyticus]|uniref:hypothetical protein n=1 Tax=Staphylococcus equorum TaxID=246432 RepID=UPI00091974DF|nr:hypothetical protein [Staphylococcus equorum]MDW3926454.1 hypothetical protein [Staphylococcus saprophyticus]MDW4219842.1 hypothetical protein [Staphylococcus saprophyticus]MDW4338250.1 hypothetical protein [Staphylococcus saprophyticus]OIS50207.1 hypothetical protein A4A29_02305 [Staphylococcus equorum]